jgi:hypothetical protein
MILLGKTRMLLIPHEILKPMPSLLGGLDDFSFVHFAHSLLHLLIFFIHFLIGSCVNSLHHSFIHPILTYHSLIHPHPCLGLGKESELSKSRNDIIGCSGR